MEEIVDESREPVAADVGRRRLSNRAVTILSIVALLLLWFILAF